MSLFNHRLASVSMLFIIGLVSVVQAADPPRQYYGENAREISRQLEAGEGWAVVSQRARVRILPSSQPADCVKYRMVTSAQSASDPTNGFTLTVEYGPETQWIPIGSGMPAGSTTSLAAARKANELIAYADELLKALNDSLATADTAGRPVAVRLIAEISQHRDHLVDVIKKDSQALKNFMR